MSDHIDTEQQLRQWLRAGDERAWAQIVVRLTPWLEMIVRPMLRSPDDIDDCVQRTLVTLWRCHDSINESVIGWLRTTVRNEAKDLLKSPRNRHDSTHGDEWDRITSTEQDPLSGAWVLHSRLLTAIRTLSPEIRQTFLLRADQGLSYQEIATVQDITVGAAKMRVLRARAILRKEYDTIAR